MPTDDLALALTDVSHSDLAHLVWSLREDNPSDPAAYINGYLSTLLP